eukprot:3121471-Alexandrium_andersonii.AAC.1
MHRAVMVGSLWTSHEAAKAGYVERPVCPFCGSERDGVHHLLWFCPAFAEVRQPLVDGAAGVSFEALPPPLRLHGIAPLVSLCDQAGLLDAP